MAINWKTWAPAIAAMVLGGVAAKIAHDSMSHRAAAQAPAPNTVRVVVTKDAVQPGQELTAEHLTLTPIATQAVPANAFSDLKAVVGRVAAAPMAPGQLVVQETLAREGAIVGLPALVPQGKRAISIDVNETSSVSGMLVPGCRVDVIATLPPRNGDTAMSRTVVQNILVQAVGQKLANVHSNDEKDPKKANDMYRSITLIATPREAEILQLAATNTRMTLVLRATGDNDPYESNDAVTLTSLSGEADDTAGPIVPIPVTPATATQVNPGPTTMPVQQSVADQTHFHTVTLIQGTKSSTVRFEVRRPEIVNDSSLMNDAAPGFRPDPGNDQ